MQPNMYSYSGYMQQGWSNSQMYQQPSYYPPQESNYYGSNQYYNGMKDAASTYVVEWKRNL